MILNSGLGWYTNIVYSKCVRPSKIKIRRWYVVKSTPEIKQIYTGIQHQLNNLIPEKWESIYLYASVVKQLNNLERWEMYFYYVPTGILRKNPMTCRKQLVSLPNLSETRYRRLGCCFALRERILVPHIFSRQERILLDVLIPWMWL